MALQAVGVVGLGIMGSAIARNLVAAGFAVAGFDVDKAKMSALAGIGGTPCGSAAHFECRNEFRHYGGDHIIFIGHVERFAYTDKPTLMFCRGQYIRAVPYQ